LRYNPDSKEPKNGCIHGGKVNISTCVIDGQSIRTATNMV
jgi:hypothetical protein